MYGVEDDGNYIFFIDYTAENSFGGAARDTFYLDVGKIENGFSVITLGSGAYSSETNQSFTKQIYRQKAELGYYEFDTETHRLNAYTENVYEYEYVEGEIRGKNESYENAWNFKLKDDDYLKLVYFADDVDLSAFEEYNPWGGENKVIIHAYRIGTHFYDATIVYADAYKTAEERLISFNYHDRNFFKEYVKDMIPLTEDEIRTALEGHTFSMRNNYGGDVDGTHTISFYPYGSLDAKYKTYANNELVMFETWQIENGSVVFSLPSGGNIVLKPYQYDDTRFLLIDETGDFSMVLTKSNE